MGLVTPSYHICIHKFQYDQEPETSTQILNIFNFLTKYSIAAFYEIKDVVFGNINILF